MRGYEKYNLWWNEEYKNLTEQELIVKLLDDLLCIHVFLKHHPDIPSLSHLFGCDVDALKVIAETRKRNPDFPITMGIADYMRREGLL